MELSEAISRVEFGIAIVAAVMAAVAWLIERRRRGGHRSRGPHTFSRR